jgi:ferredoxin
VVKRKLEVHVDGSRCTRCGACVTLCPSVFDVSAGPCRVVGQPTGEVLVLADAARWICPTDAIRAVATQEEGREGDPRASLVAASAGDGDRGLFSELAAGAERVRWALDALPWQDLEPALAGPALRMVVREMAFSENATYSATQRFLEAFGDDSDFSRWIAVWFYEETRHPHVLVEWLRRVGERLPADFEVRGRVSTPFMRSRTGTLVTNVVSEVTAAQAYRRLGRASSEPLLGRLAMLIAGDEARHAASFFRFARLRLACAAAADARRDRARGLEVLQAWLGGSSPATHPVAQMIERIGGAGVDAALGLDFDAIRTRVVRVVGLLLDVPLHRPADVAPALRDVLAQGRSGAA